MTHRQNTTTGAIAKIIGATLTGDANVEVCDVTHDSREVKKGWLFVAITGAELDAHKFVDAAIAQGASGVVSEQPRPNDFKGAWLQAEDARHALALAAAHVQHYPSRELNLVGITGTNGKTTCAFLITSIVEVAGERAALMGTIEQRIGDAKQKAVRTTPEASDTNRFLRRAVDAKCRVAVMECSSQALDLHRCDRLQFAVAAWTNLTPDHLDYHLTMERYYESKRKLFDNSIGTKPKCAVINLDDEYGRRLRDEISEARIAKDEINIITYAVEQLADVSARDIEISLRGMNFTLRTPAGERRLHTPLVGRPHVSNILLAAATALALDINLDAVERAIATCTGAPGRFEPVPHGGNFVVIVDYAHTDDALRNVLETARALVENRDGRVITVFGCGGDRDRTKRRPMGATAARLSDIVIATSDNPRYEDPEQILRDIEQGLTESGKPYEKIVDRRQAIHRAINEARLNDFVIIAGKGHEDYQTIGDMNHHFDDREVAREAMKTKD